MDRIYRQYLDLPTWNLTRVLRVLFGIGFLAFGLVNHDGLTTILASLVLLQGVLNVGCMGGACAVPPSGSRSARSVPTSPSDDES
jgi:hypothetical protein